MTIERHSGHITAIHILMDMTNEIPAYSWQRLREVIPGVSNGRGEGVAMVREERDEGLHPNKQQY